MVLRDLGLGDLLVAVPALRLLRAALPDHRVVLLGPAWVGGVAGYPVDAVADDAAAPPPDVVVNLHGRGPQSHARLDALAGARPVRRVGHAAPGWDGPAWADDPARPERRRWCDLLATCGLVDNAAAADAADDLRLPHPRASEASTLATSGSEATSWTAGAVVVHPGAAFGAKRWPVERFAAVAAALAGDGHRVVVTGGRDEAVLAARVAAAGGLDLAGRTSIDELLALVAGARLVVAGDTGIAHVATAFGVPSVTLFGPVGPEQWGPPADPRHVVLTDASLRRGDRFADEPDPALLAVGTPEVLAQARDLLRTWPATRRS